MYRITITARNEEVFATPEEAEKGNAWVDKQAKKSHDWADGLDGIDEVTVDTHDAGYTLHALGNSDIADQPLEPGGEAEDTDKLQKLADEAKKHVQGLDHVQSATGEFGPLGTVDLLA